LDTRLEQLQYWLKSVLSKRSFRVETASADASFRRYFRVILEDQTLIAMDAPPAQEDCRPFIKFAKALNELGAHTPAIYAENLEQGFILLEDLGSTDYLTMLKARQRVEVLYSDAIDALLKIQQGNPALAAKYTNLKLKEEMSLFKDWYLKKHLNHTMNPVELEVWESLQNRLCAACLEQPQVWVHRDYHSRNLMVTQTNNPGVIDFQDLVTGPLTYDLASIFKLYMTKYIY